MSTKHQPHALSIDTPRNSCRVQDIAQCVPLWQPPPPTLVVVRLAQGTGGDQLSLEHASGAPGVQQRAWGLACLLHAPQCSTTRHTMATCHTLTGHESTCAWKIWQGST